MPCSKEEALQRLFYNISSSFQLLFIFYFVSSTLLSKLSDLFANIPLFQRNQAEHEDCFSEEDVEEEEEDEEEEEEIQEHYGQSRYYQVGTRENDLVADIIHGGESLLFYHNSVDSPKRRQTVLMEGGGGGGGGGEEEEIDHEEKLVHEETDDSNTTNELDSAQDLSFGHRDSESEVEEDGVEEEIPSSDYLPDSGTTDEDGLMLRTDADRRKNDLAQDVGKQKEGCYDQVHWKKEERTDHFSGNNGSLSAFVQPQLELENRRSQVIIEKDEEEIFGDSYTIGSTSKSSSEWRSSINCRDSGTEDPFSSSSRRSCPKWESYTVFQKYDEEMLFLDRITAQKLHETESLRSIKACPRSISERIVHKIATINKKPPDVRHNPYRELEAAYVAQICLTWEALNWNYKNFQSKRVARRDFDPGCPAHIAQQFQQFQVLLQRYIENEPYEQGRRPEVYARMRLLAPKLLQVPEYRDSEDDQIKEEGFRSRISSAAFLMIMEDCIQTFMNFLKADRARPCQVLAAFFKRHKRSSVDPALLTLMKKVNNKKNMKLKDARRTRKCIRKRKLNVDEEMEILMGLIDLKVVSRVLRMSDLSEEQLHWCEEKMSKVRVSQGKLQRDSSPLFFPSH
ncbi:uncharacterized protein LOC104421666 isoform X1 [Eucalyptus grandis]|uniref:uncharacterized protein LOC104421666 isoform X1 n=1 Tax=Eucalyptus grandis TaxID=71139 RepID=UPI00192EDDB3|nr:uncharacterized protein LOC104421666 isoform X1 [Eucalyptus grandis]